MKNLKFVLSLVLFFMFNVNADEVLLKDGSSWVNVRIVSQEETKETLTIFTSMKKRIVLNKIDVKGYKKSKFESLKKSQLLSSSEYQPEGDIIGLDKDDQSKNTEIFSANEPKKQTRNVFALGYQIGGYSLIGVNYEIRVADYFGIHIGGGLLGFTSGIKIHTNPEKNSSFINMSFKDGGFGQISVIAVEYGGRWIWKEKSDMGLHYQIGMMNVLKMTDEFKEALYGKEDKKTPEFGLSLGIGISW